MVVLNVLTVVLFFSTELVTLSVIVWFNNGAAKEDDKRFLMDSSNYHWGPWTAYGSCKPSCNGGKKERTRECYYKQSGKAVDDTFACPGGVSGTYVICTQADCQTTCENEYTACTAYSKLDICGGGPNSDWGKIHCKRYCGYCQDNVLYEWGPWTPYGQCTPVCPGGTKTRSRSCFNQQTHKAETNPHSCPGTNLETSLCITCGPTQIVNGQWGPWTSLSQCSKTCGEGIATRSRDCDNPSPSGGGFRCFGSSVLRVPCKTQSCKVDGGWSLWAPWSGCSKSCDLGTLSRTRLCDNPTPQNGGSACAGNGTEIHECSSGPCPEWTHWFETDCSVSCGNGTRERLRHCSTGRDADCTGIAYEQVPCSNIRCV